MKKKIMAMVFAAMMMMAGFTATSWECTFPMFYCNTMTEGSIDNQEVPVTNTVMICGDTAAERGMLFFEMEAIICDSMGY